MKSDVIKLPFALEIVAGNALSGLVSSKMFLPRSIRVLRTYFISAPALPIVKLLCVP
jgi:hypothetical protein